MTSPLTRMAMAAVLLAFVPAGAVAQTAKTAKTVKTPLKDMTVDELHRMLQAKNPSHTKPAIVVELGRRGSAAAGAIAATQEFAKKNPSDARICDRAVELIREDVKRREVETASKRPTTAAVTALIGRLKLPEPFFKKRAADDLAKLGLDAEPALPQLRELISDADESVAKACTDAVAAIEKAVAARDAEQRKRETEEIERQAVLEKARLEREAAAAAKAKADHEEAERRAIEKANADKEAAIAAAAAAERSKREAEARRLEDAARAKRETAETEAAAKAKAERLAELDAKAESDAKQGVRIDASKGWWRQGPVRVSVQRATPFGMLVFGGTQPVRVNVLVIFVTVFNGSDAKIIRHAGWGPAVAAASDEHGNEYKAVESAWARDRESVKGPDGQVIDRVIHPGKEIVDQLMFELPIAEAKEIRFDLPADAFGGTGIIRFTLPRSMIDVKQVNQGALIRPSQPESKAVPDKPKTKEDAKRDYENANMKYIAAGKEFQAYSDAHRETPKTKLTFEERVMIENERERLSKAVLDAQRIMLKAKAEYRKVLEEK